MCCLCLCVLPVSVVADVFLCLVFGFLFGVVRCVCVFAVCCSFVLFACGCSVVCLFVIMLCVRCTV